MGITATIVAIAGTAYSIDQQMEAKEKAKQAAEEQRKIRNEQKAQNEAAAQQERRKQLREERIARSRILAASEAAGTVGSSGEIGAVGSLNTSLSANLGTNKSSIESAGRISTYSQNAANFQSEADQASANAGMASQFSSLSFQVAPTLDSIFKTKKGP